MQKSRPNLKAVELKIDPPLAGATKSNWHYDQETRKFVVPFTTYIGQVVWFRLRNKTWWGFVKDIQGRSIDIQECCSEKEAKAKGALAEQVFNRLVAEYDQ